MKIALFAAVPEEVGSLKSKVHFMGIGRENATRSIIEFIEQHKGEDYIILNIGTVGSHNKPVGSLLSIREIVSSGAMFLDSKMLPHHFELSADSDVQPAVLFSSDSFVSPEVYNIEFLNSIKEKVDCFDMESSAVFSVASYYHIPFVSYKIVSDNLDVTLDVWRERVVELSKNLVAHIQLVFNELNKKEELEFI